MPGRSDQRERFREKRPSRTSTVKLSLTLALTVMTASTQLGEATSRAGLRPPQADQSMPGRSDQRERFREKRPSRSLFA